MSVDEREERERDLRGTRKRRPNGGRSGKVVLERGGFGERWFREKGRRKRVRRTKRNPVKRVTEDSGGEKTTVGLEEDRVSREDSRS